MPPKAPKPAKKPATPVADVELAYDDFMRADLRVVKVLEAKRVEKADKLLELTVTLGGESTRRIVAGIAQSYAPEALVGKHVVIVANLAPAKIRGIESFGMILAATDADGKRLVVTPDGPVAEGTKVK